ncbi:MAG: TIGR04283 family arsenosugar biosynthesis glycosyltransferase [Flavobacteriaceae bacterium]|nr:TIGR04283 family arsenosugar biosynthesis glycosyltransferase [Flavobacteriaceae bacterium]
MIDISIIIPVYNEFQQLPKLLEYLLPLPQKPRAEILIVDGHSNDGSWELQSDYEQIRWIQSPKGRAKQLHRGALEAKGNILYFLHADSYPPKKYLNHIQNALQNGASAGCFRMRFDHSHWLLQCSAWFTRFNHISCRGGDQSLFVFREFYLKLGGFNPFFEVYEDVEFLERVYPKGRFVVLPWYILTSARRYRENGTVRLQYHFASMHLMRRCGYTAKSLQKYYKKHIK